MSLMRSSMFQQPGADLVEGGRLDAVLLLGPTGDGVEPDVGDLRRRRTSTRRSRRGSCARPSAPGRGTSRGCGASNMVGGSTRWSSTLTRIRSSARMVLAIVSNPRVRLPRTDARTQLWRIELQFDDLNNAPGGGAMAGGSSSTSSACSPSRSTSASPRRTERSRRCRTARRPTSRAPAATARAGGRAAARCTDRRRAGHHDLPADARPEDPGRSVRAGEDRDPHRHGSQPAPGRLDRSHDPGHRGRDERGHLGPQPGPARHRRRPRPAPRELQEGHRRLPVARRPGLRRGARPA